MTLNGTVLWFAMDVMYLIIPRWFSSFPNFLYEYNVALNLGGEPALSRELCYATRDAVHFYPDFSALLCKAVLRRAFMAMTLYRISLEFL